MPEHYSFFYLNEEGASVTFVSMKCDSDEAAKVWLPQFRPPSCTHTEIWAGSRRVVQADDAEASRIIQRTKEHSPSH
jgi:hypothetical protein